METNDYTSLDWLFPNMLTKQLLNEGPDDPIPVNAPPPVDVPPVVQPSIPIVNPPAEPTVGTTKVLCPLCQGETETTGELNTYKCKKCGKVFTMKECVKEGAEENIAKDITTALADVKEDVKKLHEAMADGEFNKITVDAIEKPMNALNDIRKLLGGQTWYDMQKKVK